MLWPLINFYTFHHLVDSYRNTIFEWAVGFRYDNITVKLVLGKKNLACRRPIASQANFSSHGLIFEVKKFPYNLPETRPIWKSYTPTESNASINLTFRNLIFKYNFLLTSIRKVVCRGPLPFSNVRFLRQKPRGLKLGLQLC